MAKKSSRIKIGLVCETCGAQNYIVSRNKVNIPTALKLNKFCSSCGKVVSHKEKKSLD